MDKFVIVECDAAYTVVFNGWGFKNALARYEQWWDKVEYITVANCPAFSNPWDNVSWQRNQMNDAWKHIDVSDVLIVNDLDEVVRPEAFDFISNTKVF